MVNFPEAQCKAQEELDRVLQGRLPQLSDEADLPYITAVAKEVLRWQPVTPLGAFPLVNLYWRPDHSNGASTPGVPHVVTEDDVYKGFHIPKNSIVMANAWLVSNITAESYQLFSLQHRSMLHDEEIYPDPSNFRPERFLTEDGQLDPKIRDPTTVAFGFGRRSDLIIL